ncbi:hypothetical protein IE53DRAFT_217249 [Violaceomyces palustris]|uniref:Uncharacterized protein n=1 Tax=Violaceomyces palustris TaxID=1673888 RepID=A0ACD0P4V0_9BASI|nr:hypothetical protein IE53DRAFT_217249 [Violaceomyces palustris]
MKRAVSSLFHSGLRSFLISFILFILASPMGKPWSRGVSMEVGRERREARKVCVSRVSVLACERESCVLRLSNHEKNVVDGNEALLLLPLARDMGIRMVDAVKGVWKKSHENEGL